MMNQGRDNYRLAFPRAGWWKTRFNRDSYKYDPDFANYPSPDVEAGGEGFSGLPCSGNISIGPDTVVIYSQET